MIYSLKGELKYLDSQFCVVECGGVGFKCFASLNTLSSIGSVGNEVFVFTHFVVREDTMDLYAFSSEEEVMLFRQLIGVSGVGPKAAVAILSELKPNDLISAISSSDVKAITAAQGIGKKTAERIVLELKDKVGTITESTGIDINDVKVYDKSAVNDAISALVTLGYNQRDVVALVKKMDKSLSADEMIRIGLKELARNL